MKGRFYNPSFKDIRDDYWNNGIYTFVSKSSGSVNKPKISFRDPKESVSCNQRPILWDTSISPQWVRMKGQHSFKKLETSSVMKQNTLAFLEETQKYIHKIRKPLNLKTAANSSYRVLTPTKPRKTVLTISAQDNLKAKAQHDNERIYSYTPRCELRTEGEKLISVSPDLGMFQPKLSTVRSCNLSSNRIRKIQYLRSNSRLEHRRLGRSPEPEPKDIKLKGVCMSPNSYKDLKLQEMTANQLDNSMSDSLETEHTVKYPRSQSKKSARIVISKKHTAGHREI